MNNSTKTHKAKQQTPYKVGDKVRFRTRDISFIASRLTGTLTTLCLNDYPEREATGIVQQVCELASFGYNYMIVSDHGFVCTMVRFEDIMEAIKEEQE